MIVIKGMLAIGLIIVGLVVFPHWLEINKILYDIANGIVTLNILEEAWLKIFPIVGLVIILGAIYLSVVYSISQFIGEDKTE